MPIMTIPDDVFLETGLTERGLLLELACHLFDAGKLTLWSAAKLAGLDRPGIEDALLERGIAIYRPQPSDLAEDMKTIQRLGA